MYIVPYHLLLGKLNFNSTYASPLYVIPLWRWLKEMAETWSSSPYLYKWNLLLQFVCDKFILIWYWCMLHLMVPSVCRKSFHYKPSASNHYFQTVLLPDVCTTVILVWTVFVIAETYYYFFSLSLLLLFFLFFFRWCACVCVRSCK